MGTDYGYWDITSVSNYCNPVKSGDGLLSLLRPLGPHDVVWRELERSRLVWRR